MLPRAANIPLFCYPEVYLCAEDQLSVYHCEKQTFEVVMESGKPVPVPDTSNFSLSSDKSHVLVLISFEL